MSESKQIDIHGEIIHMESQTFNSGATKLTVVLRTDSKYPQEVPVEFWKDKAAEVERNHAVGERVVVSVDIRGRGYNGRWYASLNGWRIASDCGDASDPRPPLQPEVEATGLADVAPDEQGEMPF